jgi:hypothetical protein
MLIGLLLDIKRYPELDISKCAKDNKNALFIVLDEADFKILDSKQKGTERTTFFNTPEFSSKIVYILCTVFDKEKKLIYMSDCDVKYIDLFIDAVHLSFEADVNIVAPFNQELLPMGFKDPKKCDKNTICLNRENKFISKSDIKPKEVSLNVDYIKQQDKSKLCNIMLEIEQESLDFMKHLTKAGVTKDDEGHSQKEYFGRFEISKTTKEAKEIVHTLKVLKDSLIAGEKEQINAHGSVYNFHSHPYEAYLNHKVKYGVPSIADYTAVYLLSKQGTIIHFVATLEGVYAISINPEHNIFKKPEAEVIEFIEENMLKDRENLEKYLKDTNKVGIFNIKLLPYKPTKIRANFEKNGDFQECIIRD